MRWGQKQISYGQLKLINLLKDNYRNKLKYDFSEFDASVLNQFEASIVIDRLIGD